MILRTSRYVHAVPLGNNRVLVLHALTHLRLGIDDEVARIIEWFNQPRDLPDAVPDLERLVPYDRPTLGGAVASLVDRGVLTDKTPEEELAATTAELARTNGREPGEMLEQFRRQHQEGVKPYWAVSAAQGVADLTSGGERRDVVLIGDCDLQTEGEFLRQEGTRRGLDLHIAATFPDDTRFVGERAHDIIVIGALRSRASIVNAAASDPEPYRLYLAEARQILTALRALSPAPILIDGLPEPTVQPLGLADRGPLGHRNRFRRANLALEALAETFADVHVVDIAAALGAAGSETLLDDGLTSFTHFGSPGWMLQRPESEKAAVHGLFPDPAPLTERLGGDPYRRERVVAATHADRLISVLGIGRKKCVILDLDGTLWPGVLAETGSPFAWHPEISGPYSYIGLYFGLHEALKALKRRGIVLVAVSKNDEAVVRDLWTYPDHYPRETLLTPDDFVTWRVNWQDKPENIRSIAAELGFALDSFLFIDDHPIERERVRRSLPEVEVWGDDPFTLRQRLLTDPRLQMPHLTGEAANRTALVRAQLDRGRLKVESEDEAAFLASLEVTSTIARWRPEEAATLGPAVDRVQELFQRTTQFNTTGRTFSAADLTGFVTDPVTRVFTMTVRDRFGDQGLVGAAVAAGTEIIAFALSCRVMGLGVEHRFLQAILADLADRPGDITGRIIETARNLPVRNLYKDNGFTAEDGGLWRFTRPSMP